MRELPYQHSPRADDVARYGHQFAVRLAQWDAGGHELDDAEGEYFIAHADPNMILLSQYVDGSLSTEQAVTVRRRLLADRGALAAALPMFIGADIARAVIESQPEAHPWRARARAAAIWTVLIGLLLMALFMMSAIGQRIQSARQRALVPATSRAAFGSDSAKFPFLVDTAIAR